MIHFEVPGCHWRQLCLDWCRKNKVFNMTLKDKITEAEFFWFGGKIFIDLQIRL